MRFPRCSRLDLSPANQKARVERQAAQSRSLQLHLILLRQLRHSLRGTRSPLTGFPLRRHILTAQREASPSQTVVFLSAERATQAVRQSFLPQALLQSQSLTKSKAIPIRLRLFRLILHRTLRRHTMTITSRRGLFRSRSERSGISQIRTTRRCSNGRTGTTTCSEPTHRMETSMRKRRRASTFRENARSTS